MNKVFILLLTLLAFSGVMCAKDKPSTPRENPPPCLWHGDSKTSLRRRRCDSVDCPKGYNERMRSGHAVNTITPFGISCINGHKTLCCKAGYKGPA